MFNSVFGLGGLATMYSGSPLVAAVSSAVCQTNGRIVPCSDMFNFLVPLLAVFLPIFLLLMLISFVLCVLMIISWWKIFEKAGRPGWAAIIPIYNFIVMLKIVKLSPWLVLLGIIPFFGGLALFVVTIIMNLRLAKAFGREEGFAVGLILLPYVFYPMLAFGKYTFIGVTTTDAPTASQNPPTQTPTTPAPTGTV